MITDDGKVVAQAPSNIALIKYMGKADAGRNLPANGSLSLTLDQLCSVAEVRVLPKSETADRWVAELPGRTYGSFPAAVPDLSGTGVSRILTHVERVRKLIPPVLEQAGLPARSELDRVRFELRTSNTFPAQAGIASSASSFAAVTLAVAAASSGDARAFEVSFRSDSRFRRLLASLARQGSGSSCRSFEGPWVAWEGEWADPVVSSSALPRYADLVCVVGRTAKAVSSSEAHRRVVTSPLWGGRTERVTRRLQELRRAIEMGSASDLERLAWEESWEMHSLFHTSQPPFTYWEPGSVALLRTLAPLFETDAARSPFAGLPRPIATMDAGANVHLLVPEASVVDWSRRLHESFPDLEILVDRQGSGAGLL
jgi:diphosphomevalonate decarboxylase